MSRTMSEAIRRVRYHLRDRNSQTPAFTLPEYRVALQVHINLMAGSLILGDNWETSLITLSPNNDQYTISEAHKYNRIFILRRERDGYSIPIISSAEFDALRNGDDSTSGASPDYATLFENSSHQTIVKFWPVPNQVEDIDVFRSILPDPVIAADGSISGADTAVNIPFDDAAFESLCYRVALEFYNRMSDDVRERHGLGKDTVTDWRGYIREGVKNSRKRRRKQQSSQVNVNMRRW